MTVEGRSFDTFTTSDIDAATDIIVNRMRREPGRVDESVTPFASVHSMMGSGVPSRWSPLGRWVWFRILRRRVHDEITEHVLFARRMMAAVRTVRR